MCGNGCGVLTSLCIHPSVFWPCAVLTCNQISVITPHLPVSFKVWVKNIFWTLNFTSIPTQAVSNRTDLSERTKTRSCHGNRGGQISDFQSRFEMNKWLHYSDVIMGDIASQITSLAIVYSIVYSGTDQRKHQSSEFPAQMASNAEKYFHLMTSSWYLPCECRIKIKPHFEWVLW